MKTKIYLKKCDKTTQNASKNVKGENITNENKLCI